jgi:type I restriction enzyme, S subunit
MSLTIPVQEIVTESNDPLLGIHSSWERVPLDTIAKILNGFAFESAFFNGSKGLPLLRIRDVGKNRTECFYDGNYEPRYIVHAGDLIIGMDGDFKCACWTGPDALLNQRVCKIELITKNYESGFLNLALPGYLRAINERTSSQTVRHLSSQSIAEIPLPLPPLAEQKRIVAKVEESLARVSATEERLAKVLMILKRFRQAALAEACSGRLTASWREKNHHVDSAVDLLNRIHYERKKRYDEEHVKARAERRKKPEKDFEIQFWSNEENMGWANAKLENLIYIAGRIGWRGLKAEEYTLEGPILLSVYNLNNGQEVDFSNVNHISNERYVESPEIVVKENDILMAKDGAGIGKIGIVINLPSEATVNSSLLVIRSLEAFVPKYLFYFLSGPKLQNIAKERISGSATPHLFQKDIKQFVLSVPPLLEQHEIVRRVEAMFMLADAVEKRVASATLRTEKLTQAILAKAFRGELVPTEAELARREVRSYESASDLLARIKSEHESGRETKEGRRPRVKEKTD